MNCCHTTHGTTHPTHSTGHTTHGTRTVSSANYNSCSSLFAITAKVQTFTEQHAQTANMNCQEVHLHHLQSKPLTGKSCNTGEPGNEANTASVNRIPVDKNWEEASSRYITL